MQISNPATRTLRRAADILGEAGLAHMLGVSVEELQAWLSGKRIPPASVYFKALDVVAGRPLAVRPPGNKPIRS